MRENVKKAIIPDEDLVECRMCGMKDPSMLTKSLDEYRKTLYDRLVV